MGSGPQSWLISDIKQNFNIIWINQSKCLIKWESWRNYRRLHWWQLVAWSDIVLLVHHAILPCKSPLSLISVCKVEAWFPCGPFLTHLTARFDTVTVTVLRVSLGSAHSAELMHAGRAIGLMPKQFKTPF